MGYRNVLQRTYVALCDEYSRSWLPLYRRNPESWARRETSGLVALNVVAILMAFDLLTEPDISGSRLRLYGAMLALSGIIADLLLPRVMLGNAAIAQVRERKASESRVDAAVMRLDIRLFRWGSYGLFMLLLLLMN
jgi:hypothetical protein